MAKLIAYSRSDKPFSGCPISFGEEKYIANPKGEVDLSKHVGKPLPPRVDANGVTHRAHERTILQAGTVIEVRNSSEQRVMQIIAPEIQMS